MLDALRAVIELKKVKTAGLKVTQDNRAPIVGPSSIAPSMTFARASWSKEQFFLMLDIAKLRSNIRMLTDGSEIRQIWQPNLHPI